MLDYTEDILKLPDVHFSGALTNNYYLPTASFAGQKIKIYFYPTDGTTSARIRTSSGHYLDNIAQTYVDVYANTTIEFVVTEPNKWKINSYNGRY